MTARCIHCKKPLKRHDGGPLIAICNNCNGDRFNWQGHWFSRSEGLDKATLRDDGNDGASWCVQVIGGGIFETTDQGLADMRAAHAEKIASM